MFWSSVRNASGEPYSSIEPLLLGVFTTVRLLAG